MGALTETEIFDQMETNIKLAIQTCRDLRTASYRGALYERLRRAIKLVEGCCQQASAWRSDTRWLRIGLAMAKIHEMAGNWERGYKVGAHRVKLAASQLYHVFTMLAEKLEMLQKLVWQTKTARVEKVGMILPTPLRAPMRTQGRAVHISVPQEARLILPATLQ